MVEPETSDRQVARAPALQFQQREQAQAPVAGFAGLDARHPVLVAIAMGCGAAGEEHRIREFVPCGGLDRGALNQEDLFVLGLDVRCVLFQQRIALERLA